MHIQGFQEHFSRNILIQWLCFLLGSSALLFFFADDLVKIYGVGQPNQVGFALNGLILGLFALGMVRWLLLILRYQQEEHALQQFCTQFSQNPEQALDGIPERRLIHQRFSTLKSMSEQASDIHHQALAATMMAAESTRGGLLRFVQNTLILCGVFGTIVSLSIALFGASDLLEHSVSSSGMGMVIHGMSTALSTTMTAILCYLSFAYFHGALQNVQTNLLTAIEQLSTTQLIPSVQSTPHSVDRQLANLLKAMALLVQEMRQHSDAVPQLLSHIQTLEQKQQEQHDSQLEAMQQLQHTVQQGFRLPKA